MKARWGGGWGLNGLTTPLIPNFGTGLGSASGLFPMKETPVCIRQGVGWASEIVWTFRRIENRPTTTPWSSPQPSYYTGWANVVPRTSLQSLSFSLTVPVCLPVKSIPRASESSKRDQLKCTMRSSHLAWPGLFTVCVVSFSHSTDMQSYE